MKIMKIMKIMKNHVFSWKSSLNPSFSNKNIILPGNLFFACSTNEIKEKAALWVIDFYLNVLFRLVLFRGKFFKLKIWTFEGKIFNFGFKGERKSGYLGKDNPLFDGIDLEAPRLSRASFLEQNLVKYLLNRNYGLS